MVSVLSKEQVKPNPALVSRLVRSGELKTNLSSLEQDVCDSLGLKVQITAFEAAPGQAPVHKFTRNKGIAGFKRLRVTSGATDYLQAWCDPTTGDEWTVVHYEAGDWENLCNPTLRLTRWINEWGGIHTDKQLTLQMAVSDFKRYRELPLPLREETGGRLCGKCGEDVKRLDEHIQTLHIGSESMLPLEVHVREKHGGRSVLIGRGRGRHAQLWGVSEELYIPSLHYSGYRLGLARELNKIAFLIGKSRMGQRHRKFILPNDINVYPFLAHFLRNLTL